MSTEASAGDFRERGHKVVDIHSDTGMRKLSDADCTEVRKIVDTSLEQFQVWLDWRLQHQESILRSLANSRKFPCSSQNSPQETYLPSHIENGEPQYDDKPAQLPSDPPESMEIFESGHAARQHSAMWSTEKALIADQEQVWVSSLMGVFDQLDLDRTGSIDLSEFNEAFKEVNMPAVQAIQAFKSFDESQNGKIDRMEWLHVISSSVRGSQDDVNLLTEFLSRLVNLQKSRGSVYGTDRTRHPWLIIKHDSLRRVSWDMLMIVLLSYVSVSVPYDVGFGGESTALEVIGRISDAFFCLDVLLNFRTTYRDRDDTLVVDGKMLAKKYLRSWFFLDLFASVPWELITAGLMPDLTPARLLKVGKIAKVVKLLRVPKIFKLEQTDSEILDKIKQIFTSSAYYRCFRMMKLAIIAFAVAHWLACFGSAIDSGSLDDYFDGLMQVPTQFQKYLAGMYWAMTTISTVGYGDILPYSDQERAYAMIAMVIGGSLYGYVVGSVTSIVTDIDVHAHAYHERMDLIQSWLDRHLEIPLVLRRRLRRHFKQALSNKAVLDDASVVNDLSPELRGDAAFFLIPKLVRHHPMFLNLSNSALAELLQVLQETHAKSHEFVVKMGDPGRGMYILVQGIARYDEGRKWQPPNAEASPCKFQHITQGESFGEEIIFGLEERYTYTVITIIDSRFHWIEQKAFRAHYRNMPESRNQMYAVVLKSFGLQSAPVPETREVTL